MNPTNIDKPVTKKVDMAKLYTESLRGAALLPFKRFDHELPALYRDNVRNAGYDLFARIDYNNPNLQGHFQQRMKGEPPTVVIPPGGILRIPLNVATEIPTYGVGLLFQRSSTRRKWGVRLTNGVGVIDSLFAGDGDEWEAEFENVTDGNAFIRHGDKVCQAVFLPLLPIILEERLFLEGENRGGYGTSGSSVKDLK